MSVHGYLPSNSFQTGEERWYALAGSMPYGSYVRLYRVSAIQITLCSTHPVGTRSTRPGIR